MPIDPEVVSPESGAGAVPVNIPGRAVLGRVFMSPQAAWFAWGFIAGAVLVGVFVWKTGERKKSL